MSRPKGKIDVVCQNPKCHYYHKEKGKDIIKSGKHKNTGHQRYYCKHCKSYFVETKGTPIYRKQLSKNEIGHICKLLVKKNSIRSIERITGHHRDTIGRLLQDMAEHAEEMNSYLIDSMGLTPLECSNLWSTINKNKRRLSATAKLSLKRIIHTYTRL